MHCRALLTPAAWQGWAQRGTRRVTLLGAGQGAPKGMEWGEQRAEVRKTLSERIPLWNYLLKVGNSVELGLGLGLEIGLGVMCLIGMFLHTQLRDLCMLINTILISLFEEKAFRFSGNPSNGRWMWQHHILHLDTCIKFGNKSIYCIPYSQPESVLKINPNFQLRSFNAAISSCTQEANAMQFAPSLCPHPVPREKLMLWSSFAH